jgi:hypothetical protein
MIREMMATLSHVFSSISRGVTQWVYGVRVFCKKQIKDIIIKVATQRIWCIQTEGTGYSSQHQAWSWDGAGLPPAARGDGPFRQVVRKWVRYV